MAETDATETDAHATAARRTEAIETDAAAQAGQVAIVGGGSIGVALAIVFAEAGVPVRIADVSAEMRASVPGALRERLALLDEFGLATRPASQVEAAVTVGDELAWAVRGASLVIECVTERIEVKQAVFARLDELTATEVPIVSTSSAFMPSEIAGGLGAGRARCLVAHPANPPYLLPVVELVPADFTAPEAVARVAELLAAAGLEPVPLRRELTGFVFNRLQGAVLREAYCLVRDGVIDVDGVDTIMRDALGPRWSVIGPFETVDLNTRGGIETHAARLGPAYERMGAERGQHDPWTPELVAEVTRQRRALLPLDQWEERVLWRDRALAALKRDRIAEREPATANASGPATTATAATAAEASVAAPSTTSAPATPPNSSTAPDTRS